MKREELLKILDKMPLRELQKECARAQVVLDWNLIGDLSSKTKYDSRLYYKKVIEIYYQIYGNLPSVEGPGKNVKLLYE
ncbi:MAG: hypothetical protein NZZ41_04080 [Candidatus Dojkabacteria bacterium]|nr:hypothetical protein [Candidatus Dojkabacteria bacterium]